MQRDSEDNALHGEIERLMSRISQLEDENRELRDKLDEITDKEVHCVGVQTAKYE